MKARWMAAKVAKMKPRNLRFVEAGTVAEARGVEVRPVEMPTSGQVKASEAQAIAEWLASNKVKRATCEGKMDEITRKGRYMRNARGNGLAMPLKVGAGRGAIHKLVAAPPQKSCAVYSRDVEGRLYVKA